VAVVGGGITGLTTAYLLAKTGAKVVLLESRRIGDGETGHTTAHLTEIVDTRYETIESRFGNGAARLVALGQRLAIKSIRNFVEQWDVPAQLASVPAYLYAETYEERDELRKEVEACRRAEVPAVWSEECPLPFATKGALRLDNQAQIDPGPYLAALARAFVEEGGQIYEQALVTSVEDGEPCRVETAAGKLLANKVVLATHVPFTHRVLLQTKIAAYRTYAVAVPLTDETRLEGLFWDCQTPYHFTRKHVIDGRAHLIVGGEDHRVAHNEGEEVAAFERLESYVRDHFESRVLAPTYRWSGQIIEPVDGLPYVGKDAASENVFVATGYSGNGMTWGTLSAFVLADLVRGLENPWRDLLQATRIKPFASAKSYLAENALFPEHLLVDRLKRAKREDALSSLPAGQGAIFRIRGERMAVFRRDDGSLVTCSAVCPHLGCIVHWNAGERSWDCPCHGSRFDPEGQVLNGPASSPLPKRTI